MKSYRWREQISRFRGELAIGRGGTLQPRPVRLEPPYTSLDKQSGIGRVSRLAANSSATALSEPRFITIRPSDEDRDSPVAPGNRDTLTRRHPRIEGGSQAARGGAGSQLTDLKAVILRAGR